MTKTTKSAIEEYQCPGCVVGGDISCFKKGDSLACSKHLAGTLIRPGVGKVFLGMPAGFNRLGPVEEMKIRIYNSYEESDWKYDKWNIPVWKHLNKKGHTIVRGITPRTNHPFIHIFLSDCMDEIDCLEITEEDINYMD